MDHRGLSLPRIWLQPMVVAGLASTLFGTGLVWATRYLPAHWVFLLISGFALLCLAFLSGHFERFLIGCLFLVIPINPDIHFDVGISLDTLNLPTGTPRLGFSLTDFLLCLLYPLWINKILVNRQTQTVRWPRGATILICFMAWSVLSMLNSQNRVLSLVLLSGFVKAFFYFFYMANVMRTEEDLRFVARCLITGLLIESFISCAQQAAGGPLGLEWLGERADPREVKLSAGRIFRVGGTLGHPNFLGGYLASVLPLAFALILAPSGKKISWVTAGSFILGTVVLILTFSRSAWFTTVLSCLVLMGWWLVKRRKSLSLTPVFAIGLSVVLVTGVFAPLITARWVEPDDGAALSRIPQIKVAWEMIKSHPVLGVGLNNYNVVSHLYETYVEDPRGQSRVYLYEGRLHNVFLATAAETGLAGLFWLLLFIGTVSREGFLKFLQTDNESIRLILLGMGLSLFARLAHDFVHTGNFATNLLLWIYAGCFVSGLAEKKNE